MFFSVSVGFRPDEVATYERKRYRGLDQRLVNARETSILRKLLSLSGPADPAAGGTARARRTLRLRPPGLLADAGLRSRR
jgi:hypothetical protein